MANIKLTNLNKQNLLLDWKNDSANRSDILYFIKDDININEIERLAFDIGILIRLENHDGTILKITFIDLLN